MQHSYHKGSNLYHIQGGVPWVQLRMHGWLARSWTASLTPQIGRSTESIHIEGIFFSPIPAKFEYTYNVIISYSISK